MGGYSSCCSLQYVVIGPRVKFIILNILSESKRSELKFSLKIAFVFKARDNFNVESSKLKYFSCNSKSGDRALGPFIRECRPWSANHVNATESNFESQ